MSTIRIRRGDSPTLRFTVTDADDAPLDLTDLTAASFTAREYRWSEEAVLTVELDDGLAVVDPPADGLIDVLLASALTEDLEPGDYWYDLEVNFPGPRRFTVDFGVLVVAADVTL